MEAKFYVLDSYRGLSRRVYSNVAAVIGETEKTYSAHIRYYKDWSQKPRRINKDATGGRFATFEKAEAALKKIEFIRSCYSKKRAELIAEEKVEIAKLLWDPN